MLKILLDKILKKQERKILDMGILTLQLQT